jgi:uncharacterized membrane protein
LDTQPVCADGAYFAGVSPRANAATSSRAGTFICTDVRVGCNDCTNGDGSTLAACCFQDLNV